MTSLHRDQDLIGVAHERVYHRRRYGTHSILGVQDVYHSIRMIHTQISPLKGLGMLLHVEVPYDDVVVETAGYTSKSISVVTKLLFIIKKEITGETTLNLIYHNNYILMLVLQCAHNIQRQFVHDIIVPAAYIIEYQIRIHTATDKLLVLIERDLVYVGSKTLTQ